MCTLYPILEKSITSSESSIFEKNVTFWLITLNRLHGGWVILDSTDFFFHMGWESSYHTHYLFMSKTSMYTKTCSLQLNKDLFTNPHAQMKRETAIIWNFLTKCIFLITIWAALTLTSWDREQALLWIMMGCQMTESLRLKLRFWKNIPSSQTLRTHVRMRHAG